MLVSRSIAIIDEMDDGSIHDDSELLLMYMYIGKSTQPDCVK